jgi:nitroreductase
MVPSRLPSVDLEEAIAAATRAPSVLNTQPWLFVAGDDVIELRADLRRALPALDPLGRALIISCGAALLGLRLAVLHQRRELVVRTFPHALDPELLAELRIGGPRSVPENVAPADEQLYSALPRRHTNRQPLRAGRPDDAVLGALAAAAAVEGARLDVLDGIDTEQVVDVLHDADRAQRLDPAIRAEVARWTHRPGDADDGLRDDDLGPRASDPSAAVRDFALGAYVEGRMTSRFERVPLLAVLSTRTDTRADWLRAGQALHRVLLAATIRDLRCSLLTQPLEREELRELLRPRRSAAGVPQVLLRLGYGPDAPASRRRPISEVLRHRPTSTERGFHPG